MRTAADGSVEARGAAAGGPVVLVVAECALGRLEKVSLELLGDARQAARALNGHVELALPVSPSAAPAALETLQAYLEPAERVHLFESAALAAPAPEALLQVLAGPVAALEARLVMIGATANGRELAPRLAARLGYGCVPHCLAVKVTPDGLGLTRIAFGGRAHQQSSWPLERPLVVTMKPGVADAPAARPAPAELTVQRATVEPEAGGVRVLEQLPPDPRTQDLGDAERIVAGGRGVGGAEGFRAIAELADALGASVGASRVAVDRGWIAHERQVGQTGKTVTPGLYVACGISGASHHLAGMRGSERIVAVNTDPNAPIFSVAQFGTVADLHELLPRVAQRIREHRRRSAQDAAAAATPADQDAPPPPR